MRDPPFLIIKENQLIRLKKENVKEKCASAAFGFVNDSLPTETLVLILETDG